MTRERTSPAAPLHVSSFLGWCSSPRRALLQIFGLLALFTAMLPAAAVSGYYFAHPKAQYFGVGKLDLDQLEDYARRKGMELRFMEKWLRANLGYEPAARHTTERAG